MGNCGKCGAVIRDTLPSCDCFEEDLMREEIDRLKAENALYRGKFPVDKYYEALDRIKELEDRLERGQGIVEDYQRRIDNLHGRITSLEKELADQIAANVRMGERLEKVGKAGDGMANSDDIESLWKAKRVWQLTKKEGGE